MIVLFLAVPEQSLFAAHSHQPESSKKKQQKAAMLKMIRTNYQLAFGKSRKLLEKGNILCRFVHLISFIRPDFTDKCTFCIRRLPERPVAAAKEQREGCRETSRIGHNDMQDPFCCVNPALPRYLGRRSPQRLRNRHASGVRAALHALRTSRADRSPSRAHPFPGGRCRPV